MKDYKLKEALCNLKQAFDRLETTFDIMIDILNDMHLEEKEDEL